MAGIVVSVLIIHFQIFIDGEKERQKYRPEFAVGNDYQLIKSGSRVYFNDKYWYHLRKKQNSKKSVDANAFEKVYVSENKRDKAFSIEIVNNQPVFNLHIIFGDDESREIIPKLSANERIYVISKAHQEAIHQYFTLKESKFHHVPREIKLYYTTLVGEINCYHYSVDVKGYCNLLQRNYGVAYPEQPKENTTCDYFLNKA